MLENINAKLDEFSSALKNQFSFNKMIETQLAQIAAAIPSYEKIEFLANLREQWRQPTLLLQNMAML